MESSQANWKTLCNEKGEEEAEKHLANALREAADLIEAKEYPRVFGCELKPPPHEKFGEPFMWTVSVTLSYPWPG